MSDILERLAKFAAAVTRFVVMLPALALELAGFIGIGFSAFLAVSVPLTLVCLHYRWPVPIAWAWGAAFAVWMVAPAVYRRYCGGGEE